MNAECTEAWAEQMCVEYLDDRQIWVCPKGAANHAWDVSVYNFCLADYVGTRYMQITEEEHDYEEQESKQPPQKGRLW
jgi:hypothetical protein